MGVEPKNGIFNICADEHPIKSVFYRHQSIKLGLDPPIFQEGVTPHKIVDNQYFKSVYDFEYQHSDPCFF